MLCERKYDFPQVTGRRWAYLIELTGGTYPVCGYDGRLTLRKRLSRFLFGCSKFRLKGAKPR